MALTQQAVTAAESTLNHVEKLWAQAGGQARLHVTDTSLLLALTLGDFRATFQWAGVEGEYLVRVRPQDAFGALEEGMDPQVVAHLELLKDAALWVWPAASIFVCFAY